MAVLLDKDAQVAKRAGDRGSFSGLPAGLKQADSPVCRRQMRPYWLIG
ncbi:MAG: hypothetical protein LBC72_00365 [Spirochaetaceae bacterium]|nr:hypothetical protein [Spirochaetaceae bacterium]